MSPLKVPIGVGYRDPQMKRIITAGYQNNN